MPLDPSELLKELDQRKPNNDHENFVKGLLVWLSATGIILFIIGVILLCTCQKG